MRDFIVRLFLSLTFIVGTSDMLVDFCRKSGEAGVDVWGVMFGEGFQDSRLEFNWNKDPWLELWISWIESMLLHDNLKDLLTLCSDNPQFFSTNTLIRKSPSSPLLIVDGTTQYLQTGRSNLLLTSEVVVMVGHTHRLCKILIEWKRISVTSGFSLIDPILSSHSSIRNSRLHCHKIDIAKLNSNFNFNLSLVYLYYHVIHPPTHPTHIWTTSWTSSLTSNSTPTSSLTWAWPSSALFILLFTS